MGEVKVGEVKENKLNVFAVRKSIANAKKLGTLPMSDEPVNKEVTPPLVEAIPQDPPTRTHKQAMAAFHNIQKEDQQRQPEKAKIQDPPARTHKQAMAAFHNIEKEDQQKANAQELGTQPQGNETLTKEITPPPAVAVAPSLPARTHKQAMAAFHNIESQYKQSTPSNSPQIEQTPTPVITEKKNIFKRLSAWFTGKS